MYAAVIEWPSDAAMTPTLITAGSVEHLLPHVIGSLGAIDPSAYDDDGDTGWLDRNPYPSDTASTAERATWLIAMREATSALWVNLYGPLHGGATPPLALRATLIELGGTPADES